MREENGKKLPDWDKLLGDKDSGSMLETMFQKMRGFVAPGSHAGRSSNRDEAEFALMVTHTIVNLGLRKLMKNYVTVGTLTGAELYGMPVRSV